MTTKTRATVATVVTVTPISGEDLKTTADSLTYKRTNKTVRTAWLQAFRGGVESIADFSATLYRIALALTVAGVDLTNEPAYQAMGAAFRSQVKASATLVKAHGEILPGSDAERTAVQFGQRAARYATATSTLTGDEVQAVVRAASSATNVSKSVQAVGQTWTAWEGTDNPEGRQTALVNAARSGKPVKPVSAGQEQDDTNEEQEQADKPGSPWERADRAVTVLAEAWDTLTDDEREALRARLASFAAKA